MTTLKWIKDKFKDSTVGEARAAIFLMNECAQSALDYFPTSKEKRRAKQLAIANQISIDLKAKYGANKPVKEIE
jgi:hypothetical protein